VYVAGRTLSNDFPGTAGGAQPQPAASGFDGFVARLNPGLTQLAQSTYLGGSAVDEAFALAVAPSSGAVYAAGDTSSSDFPCTQAGGPTPTGGGACLAGAAGAQSSPGGGFDAFVSLLTPTLQGLTQSTYLGGTDLEDGYTVLVAPPGSPYAGDVYLGGRTLSTNLPDTAAGAQPTQAGNYDGFAARLSGDLQTLDGTTYLGGASDDSVTSLAAVQSGAIYAGGQTASRDFPCTTSTGPAPKGGPACSASHAGAQYKLAGATDGFLGLLSGDLGTLAQATYLGGSATESLDAVSIAPASSSVAGSVYAAGQTTSPDYPGTAGAAQPAFAGTSDGYAVAVSSGLQGPEVTLKVQASAPGTAAPGDNVKYEFTVTNDSPASGQDSTDATGVVVSDVLNQSGGASTIYVKATSSQGSTCTHLSGVVTCDLGTIAKGGGSATVTVTAQATKNTGSVTNRVSVSSDEAPAKNAVLSADTTTKIQKPPSSGGGGGFGAAPLSGFALLIGATWLAGLRRRRRRTARSG